MAQRYRMNYLESGDVIDPTPWVLDNNELAGEVNGGLDRENLAEGDIVRSEIVAWTFTRHGIRASSTTFTADGATVAWQGGNNNDANGIFAVTVTCAEDCLLHAEMTLTAGWIRPPAPAPASSYSVGTDGWTVDTVQIQLCIDGVAVATSGYYDDWNYLFSAALVGSAVVTAGQHIISVQCQLMKRNSNDDAGHGTCTGDVAFYNRTLLYEQEKR